MIKSNHAIVGSLSQHSESNHEISESEVSSFLTPGYFENAGLLGAALQIVADTSIQIWNCDVFLKIAMSRYSFAADRFSLFLP